MSAGQRVWLDVIDASSGFPIVANDAVTSSDVGKALIYPIDRDSLERLADDTAITLRAQVALNGSVDERSRLRYPTRTIKIKKAILGREDFESFEKKEYGYLFESETVLIVAYGLCWIDTAPSGMTGKALRVETGSSQDSAIVFNGKPQATSLSFRHSASKALTIYYSKGGAMVSEKMPAGLRTLTSSGLTDVSTGIHGRGPYTLWIDDVLYG